MNEINRINTPLDNGKPVNIYTNYNVCKNCKGLCCTSYAGIYSPEDFSGKLSVEYITALLLTRRFSVDFNDSVHPTEEDPCFIGKNYFIRPRHVDEVIGELNMAGVCINWKYETGCSLKEVNRPFQCRMIIPIANSGLCKAKKTDKASALDMAERWQQYQPIIKKAIKGYNYLKNIIVVNQAEVNDNIDLAIKNIMVSVQAFAVENDILKQF